MIDIIALSFASVLLVPGIFMAFVPMLPALSYMFVVALLFGLYDGFDALSARDLFILLGLVVLSIAVDHTSGILGAKYGGAHAKSLLWGILGGVVGTLAAPLLGSLIGLFAAVLLAEIYYKKTKGEALKAAGGALVGTAAGIAVNVFLALAFIGLFIVFALK